MDEWKGSQVSSCELIKGHHVCDCTSSLYVIGNSGELCKVISMKSGSFTFRRPRLDCENYYILMMAVGLFHSCTSVWQEAGQKYKTGIKDSFVCYDCVPSRRAADRGLRYFSKWRGRVISQQQERVQSGVEFCRVQVLSTK